MFKTLVCTIALCLSAGAFAQIYDLPILFIDSKQKCLDFYTFEKIPATIKVLDGKSNNVADSSKATPYEIGIKVRGRGSSGFPKLNYTIEF
ncbi:MAG: spore coat protein CotH, partial [Fibrobacter sp.]|nr:spore coat protein CotH [Fibrobacter sp.]